MTDFVVHPDGTVDYPPTGSYTMSPEEFANADTQRAWSVPPQPQPYYDESPYQDPPHQDWAGVVKLVGGIVAAGVVIVAVIVLAISLTKPTPTTTVSATQTVTATPIPTQTVTALPPQTVTAIPGPTQTVTALPAPPPDAEQQLRQIANSDRPFVAARMADYWVAQLSSKRPGVVDQGIVWDNATTLREHVQLRRRYDARLLWSGEWSTFSASNFWVTVAGYIFPTAADALAWCTSQGFDRDHCFAKIVSTTHPVEGSTAYNRGES